VIPVEERPSAAAAIRSDLMRDAVEEVILLVRREAQRLQIKTGTIIITGFRSYEENDEQVVVTHWINASSQGASRYRDALADALHAWKASLPARTRSLVADHIAVAVRTYAK
jgi:hypothetical protein